MTSISSRVDSRNSSSAPSKSISMAPALSAAGAARQAGRRSLGTSGQRGHRGAQRDRPAKVQVRVVLEGEADAAEHLDAVLGDGHGAVERHRCGDIGGEVRLLRRWSGRAAAPASHATAATDSVVSSISAHRCLTAWNEPIGAPNCSRTLA